MALPDFKRVKLANMLANSGVGAMAGMLGAMYFSGSLAATLGIDDPRSILAIGSTAGAAVGATVERLIASLEAFAKGCLRIGRFATIVLGRGVSRYFTYVFQLWLMRRQKKDGTLSEGDYQYIVRRLHFRYVLNEEPPVDPGSEPAPGREAQLRVVPSASPSPGTAASGD